MASKVNVYIDSSVWPATNWMPHSNWVNDGSYTDPDKNGTPRWIRNGDGHDWMVSQGALKMPMIYDGSLNRSGVWMDDNMNFLTPDKFDWSREGNHNNPPTKIAVERVMKLINNPNTYNDGPKSGASKLLNGAWVGVDLPEYRINVEKHLPVIFDLENPGVAPDFNSQPEEVAIEKIMNMVNAVKYAKEWAWWNMSRVGAYGWPVGLAGTQRNTWAWHDKSQLDELANAVDFVAPSVYFWDETIMNPQLIFSHIDSITAGMDRYYSWLPRVFVIHPTYQVYWPQNDPSGKIGVMNGKPIEMDLWKRFIKYLVDRDYDLYWWQGLAPMDEGTKARAKVCLDFIETPKQCFTKHHALIERSQPKLKVPAPKPVT